MSYLFIFISMLSIQLGATLAKGLFPLVGAAGTTGLRVFISALILLVVANPVKNKIEFKQILADKVKIKNIAAYGFCLGLMNLFFYFSIEKIPLGLAVTIEFLGPLVVSVYFSKKLKDFLWVILAFAGLALLYFFKDDQLVQQKSLDMIGISFALIAGFFWGGYIVLGKRISHAETSSIITTSLGMCFAALIALPAGLFFNFPQVINSSFWFRGTLVAILSSAVPYAFEMKAMQKIPEKTFGILMSFEPVIAICAGLVFLDEKLYPVQIIAMALVIIACLGSSLSQK